MKFKNIYEKSERNVESALLNLWTLGKHPMRESVKEMFKKEPLMAEPVFQSTFAWTPTDSDQWKRAFEAEVIAKLGIGQKYIPFSHQADSWLTLSDGKSIVVTSGTGSGKTECFMYPVINDIVKENNHDAVQAIFLYPLNALMADQCDRLGELCDKVGIKFAVYNGNTPETVLKGTPRKPGEHESQLRSRKEIRSTPPQILLSNPSMLEYMLVRGSDQTIINQSKGKLRWIIIDEAHSYSGSSAIELKLQIRRILDAFETDKSKIRFACTSATIGGADGADSLRDLISALTGQDKSEIVVIGGERQIPDLSLSELSSLLSNKQLTISANNVLKVRNDINTRSGMSLKDMWMTIHGNMEGYTISSGLEEIDSLCELKDQRGNNVLSLRIHFHMRTINGLYACVNPSCSHHSIDNKYRNITSYSGSSCPHCNSTMLELVQCKDCAQFMIQGEVKAQSHIIRQLVERHESNVGLTITDAAGNTQTSSTSTWTSFSVSDSPISDNLQLEEPTENSHYSRYSILKNTFGLQLQHNDNGKYLKLEDDNRSIRCTCCGASESSFLHFNVPVDNLNKIVGRILLEETAGIDEQWGKYIAFTDSRQGTAINAKGFNIESERIIGIAKLIRLITKKKEDLQTSSTYKLASQMLDFFILQPSSPERDKSIADLEEKLASSKAEVTPQEASQEIYDLKLFNHFKSDDGHLEAYKSSVIRTLLGHRTLRKPSIESLGIIEFVYEGIENIKMPTSLTQLRKSDGTQFKDEDWQDFLVIALDYVIRIGNHIQPLIPFERQYVREGNLSTPIAPPYNQNNDVKKWPKVNTNNNGEAIAHQNRLLLLLCAALGYDTKAKVTHHIDQLNSLMEAAWSDLVNNHILTKVINNGIGYTDQEYYGTEHVGSYYLDISKESTKCKLRILEKAWQCPVTRRLINRTFCGYSPTLSGNISARNFSFFKITDDQIEMPIPPSTKEEELIEWINTDPKVLNLKKKGLWSDIQDNYFLTQSSYLAAEHSAQQSDDKLSEYTDKFKRNIINVLNCSTTMEMGVDIGDIEVVLMDTVPPAAANYLQRAGRAGRARQSKAVAFTLCNATPIGMKAFRNPMWALSDSNNMKMVLASNVITQRHINSFLFHHYVNKELEKFTAVTNLYDFFGSDKDGTSFCNDLITKLNGYVTDSVLESQFHDVFGDIPYSVNKTISTIKGIKEEYWKGMDNLKSNYDVAVNDSAADPNNEGKSRKMHALLSQITRIRHENLLTYLSEKQFIPNANMPTGIVEFDYCDKTTADEKLKLLKAMKSLKQKIEDERNGTNDPIKINELKKERREKSRKFDALCDSTIVSRDVRTALNEYAPGQTVVINERNYVSAGISLFDNLEGQPRRRYLYHCENCGHTIYTTYKLDDYDTTCDACKRDEYVSVIPRLARKNLKYTMAYEPIKFRTSNAPTTRFETTEKRYFDIRVELTELSWTNRSSLNGVDFVSQQEGEIVYYNLGLGEGFAICSLCGHALLDNDNDNNNPMPSVHKNLDGYECPGGTVNRHIAFTGRQQTCYTAMRFYENGLLSKDQNLAISMGVILKRALVEYLHIDENEVDFGIKNEKDAVVLFVYDVNKGGCGYSMHLGDPVECQEIIDIAYNMVMGFACHCENDVTGTGSCSHCLIERTTFKYRDYLSKSAVLTWLLNYKGNRVDVPDIILSVSQNAQSRPETLENLLSKAIEDNSVSEISICVSAKGCIEGSDFIDVKTPIGKHLTDAIQNGKHVKVIVEYDGTLDDFDTLFKLANLKEQLVNYEIVPVKSLGTFPSLMLFKTDTGTRHYFTDTGVDMLSASADWIECTKRIFEDIVTPVFIPTTLPTKTKIKEMLIAKGRVIFEGDIPNRKYKISGLFSNGICRGILKESENLKLLENILLGETVSINFSDAYVNSALAGLILVYMIKEVCYLFKCNIRDITLQLDSKKRNIGSDYNSYKPISTNFPDKEYGDDFLEDLFNNEIGLTYRELPNTKHHRWLKFTTSKGSVELRPDHGIDGGWYTRTSYNDIDNMTDYTNIEISKAQYGSADVIYYIIVDKKK